MSEKDFYIKTDKGYEPVSRYDGDLWNSISYGHHLITIEPKKKTTRLVIDPAYAPLIAAAHPAREKMVKAMLDRESEFLGPGDKVEQEAWATFKATVGSKWCIRRNSFADVVDAGINVLTAEAAELMANPAVKIAYEEFLTVCRLAIDKGK